MSNHLYYGDNLEILRNQIDSESVDLCYIDPPFNSQRNYNLIYKRSGTDDIAQSRAFVDTWNWNVQSEELLSEIRRSSVYPAVLSKMIDAFEMLYGKSGTLSYLVNMTVRIHEIWRVLKPTGSFYLHCDKTMSPYIKIILDSIFCTRGGKFRNEIIWCYDTSGRSKSKFAQKHDTIYYYTKSKNFTFNGQDVTVPMKCGSTSRGGRIVTDENGRKYRLAQAKKTSKGETRYYKYYLDKGKIPNDWWSDINALNSSEKERLGYNTQKPLALLERIIRSSSNEGDVVLDAFCGCGTTVDAAQMLNRRWIGIDITYQAVSLITKRLQDRYGKVVLDAVVVSGVPRDIESARALARKRDDRLHKEFERWSILTYANNMAKIEDHSDVIDGEAYIIDDQQLALFSVHQGVVTVKDVREFHTLVDRHASAGVIISLEEPSRSVRQEASRCGNISQQTCIIPKPIPKIQIVTVQQILDGVRMNLPLAEAVLKKAVSKKQRSQTPSFAGI